MPVITAGDINRFAMKDRAEAYCMEDECAWALPWRNRPATGQSSGTVGRKAREHTRETDHTTHVYHRHTTEYRKEG